MKGLVLNNFYAVEDNIKLSSLIALFLSLISFTLRDPKVISMIIAMQIFVFLVNISSSLQVDESSKWNKMEVTLPVKRIDIITAKYLSFIILILFGLIFSLLNLIILNLRGIEISPLVLLDGYSYGLALAINTIAILYPIILKFGAKKSETMLLIAVGLSLAIRFFVWAILISIISHVNFNGIEVGIATTILSVFIFIISYVISIHIHKNKSF